jgi:hypothetical protein
VLVTRQVAGGKWRGDCDASVRQARRRRGGAARPSSTALATRS